LNIQRKYTYMCVENVDNLPSWVPNRGTGYSFTHIKIASEKCCRPAVERVSEHAALLDGPLGENDQASTNGTREVEFSIGEDMLGLLAKVQIVAVYPKFLKRHNIKCRGSASNAKRDFV
jgi:hypothetical protein